MSLYAVKNNKGLWLSLDGSQTGIWYANNPTLFKDKSYADAQSMGRKAHVVELVEAPAKVVVSEEEAAILTRAKEENSYALSILHHYAEEHGGYLLGNKSFEDRLMRAYVNGWVVKKSKWFRVKVPHTGDDWYWQDGDSLHANNDDCVTSDFFEFTEADIEHYGLGDCERVEVADDGKN